jgi:pimeloyl-ACP methyl ester carboxylesterase
MNLPYPVIVIPGITASYLLDEYPVDPEIIWSVMKNDYDRISLHPNDLRYEAIEPARVRSGKLFEIAYNELINELRYNLKDSEDLPVPVYPFSYDWRMPLETAQKELDDFITEVINRTKILKHYHAQNYADNAKVNLVGHSMGGLVITGYLANKRLDSRVHKVVSLATPFQGSFEAVIKIITGTANLGTSPPSSREREAARITPGLYHLLPSFKNGIVVDKDLPDSFFEPLIWQEGVTQSLEEFIRLKGLPSANIKTEAMNLLTTLLNQAKAHRAKTNAFNLNDAGLDSSKWLAVAGIDAVTRVEIKVSKINNSPNFELESDDRKNEWDSEENPDSRSTGDGTVPFEGSVPKFLKEENLVCVSPEDFGYWEIQDKATAKLAGFHGLLPSMNMLHRLIVRFFKDKPDPKGNTWGRPAPGIKNENWQPPLDLKNKNK